MTQRIINKSLKLTFLFALIIFTFKAAVAVGPLQHFNNGRIRIGNGWQYSINEYGNLLQPWYYNGSNFTWYKLTYSSYPLDIRWGVGGDGTSEWNTNGDMINNPTMVNQVIDYSGFTVTDAGTGAGYGTIITRGDITIGGSEFLAENTYTLLQTEAYISIKTKLTNKSGVNASNVRVWVGTRDDWVGTDDGPTKERGNLVNGAFEMISNAADQAKSILIYSGNEAAMFYSNSDRVQTSINWCCSFTNSTNQNPATSQITHDNDGSYAMFVRLNDLSAEESDEFTWYYAAGSLAEINDIIAAVAAAATNVSYTSFDYNYSYHQSGTAYTIVVPDGSTAPTAEQIKAGVDYTGATVLIDTSYVITENVDTTICFTGLTINTCYDIYTVTEYGTPVSEFSVIKKTNTCTLENDAPVGSLIADQTTCFNTAITGLALNITDEYPGDETFTVTGTSSNTNIVENSGISITGTGASRSISITPKTGASGTCTITIGINDSEYSPAPPSLKNGVIHQTTVTFDVTVRNDFTPGAILTTGEAICYGSGNPSVIGNSIAASGGNGTITYKWESSTDGFATAGSVIGGATNATYDPPAGLTETTSYRRYAHDGACNTNFEVSTGTWTVTVQEPLTVIAQNVIVYLDAAGNGSTTAALVNNGSFSCNGIATMTLSKTNFTCSDIGENVVILTVTDNSAYVLTAEAIVKVVDNIIPTVRTRNVTVNLDGNGAASVTAAMIDNGSYDNCGIESIELSKTNFNCSNIGLNPVILTVRDVNGNVNTRTAFVTVRDITNPQLTLVGPIAIQRVDGHYVKYDIRQLVDLVTDNADACSGNLTWAITKASSDEPDDARGNDDGSTVNDIVIPGDGQEIEVRAESSTRGNGRVYTVYIEAEDASGNKTEKNMLITVNARGRYTAIDDGPAYWVFSGAARVQANAALATTMMQNTPNPFKSTTTISFSLENNEYANLAIYSMSGQLIKTLVSEVKQAGNHTVVWEADDNKGILVPPGMYIYILKTKEIQYSNKIILLK
ncbi:MAG: T9SS type A sorting domain-containing protein [Bacteroidetes bacterium]|nr:T9SS type A sorting domain-containing protein [Bacteroidota bacterium]